MSEKSLVSEALADLKKELANLRNKKRWLGKSMEAAQKAIKTDHRREIELRRRISLLAKEESKLAARRIEIDAKMSKLKERLAKISKISEELEEV